MLYVVGKGDQNDDSCDDDYSEDFEDDTPNVSPKPPISSTLSDTAMTVPEESFALVYVVEVLLSEAVGNHWV